MIINRHADERDTTVGLRHFIAHGVYHVGMPSVAVGLIKLIRALVDHVSGNPDR